MSLTIKEYFNLKEKGDPFDAAGASEGKMEAVMTSECKIQLGRSFRGKQAFVLLDLNHVNMTLDSQGAKKIILSRRHYSSYYIHTSTVPGTEYTTTLERESYDAAAFVLVDIRFNLVLFKLVDNEKNKSIMNDQ